MVTVADQLNAALLGRYAIQRELGAGGMATVFLADDLRHRRSVAIKVLHRELAAAVGRERFLREIEFAAGLSHPHILPLHDSGVAGDLLYFVMPYVAGESLRQRLAREKQLPLADALRIARDVADALDYAHRQGVVHRDIKPDNILLLEQHAVLTDFGIARAVVAAGAEQLTRTGVVVGTPAYMSPEQGAAGRDLDGRSDVYGLGCVVYEMLAGQPPFTGPTAESLAHQHLNVPPRSVTDLRPAVPARVAGAILRSLAKTPADRFKTASEFAAALALGAEPEKPVPVSASAPPRRRWIAVGSVAAILLVAFAAWKLISWPIPSPEPAKKAWILVAEFDGPAADSMVVAATRDLVMAALDQSEIVATVPPDQIRQALYSAGKPPSTRVDADMARELAYRSAVRTVLEGRVGRLGSGYSVVLRVIDADSARVVASVSDAAADERALIPMVDRLAKKLRAGLGESRRALQNTKDLTLSVTPSFEAFRAWAKGRERLFAMDNHAAIAWYRRALALDPEYAGAWASMGYAFGNLDEPDSSLEAFRQAQARPDRLMGGQALFSALAVSFLTQDFDATLALSDRQVQLMPERWTVHNNRSTYLRAAGRFAEALESARTAERVSPFGASQQVLTNEFWSLLWLGRVDEARALVPRLKGDLALEAPMDLAAVTGQWSVAESLATILQNRPSAVDDVRRTAGRFRSAALASRGEMQAADQVLRQLQSVAESNDEIIRANRARWDRLRLALFSRGVAVDTDSFGKWDSSTAGLVVHAVWAAAAGDSTLARGLLATIHRCPAPELAREGVFGPEIVEAWLAARSGRWEDVLRHLGPTALKSEPTRYTAIQSVPLIRWLVAEAYERLDRPDSAAAYFERAVAPPPEGGTDITQIRMASSFAHRRLTLLYARMGRREEARRQWEIFSATFTRPDPGMKPMVEEARAALASAEGMARTARR